MEIICTQFKGCIKLMHFVTIIIVMENQSRERGGGAFTNFCDLKKKLFFFKSETFCRLRSSPNDLRFGLSLQEF